MQVNELAIFRITNLHDNENSFFLDSGRLPFFAKKSLKMRLSESEKQPCMEMKMESSLLRPIYTFVIMRRHLVAVVIITAAKEEMRKSCTKE